MTGKYYTPKELLENNVIETGTGGFLKKALDWLMSLFVNPPYSKGK